MVTVAVAVACTQVVPSIVQVGGSMTTVGAAPKPTPPDPRDKKIAEQEREIARWKQRAERAEALVELQKKVADLLGTALPRTGEKP